MQRITFQDIRNGIDRLNSLTNSPAKPWARDENGKMVAQIGNYHMNETYGGVGISRMATVGGGVSCPIFHGAITKRGCFNQLHAFINGIEAARRESNP